METYRVLSRVFGIDTPINNYSHKIFKKIKDLMQNAPPGEYNQALMEFGALQCTPNLNVRIVFSLRLYCISKI